MNVELKRLITIFAGIKVLNKVIEKAKKEKYIYVDNDVFKVSEKGEKYLLNI